MTRPSDIVLGLLLLILIADFAVTAWPVQSTDCHVVFNEAAKAFVKTNWHGEVAQ